MSEKTSINAARALIVALEIAFGKNRSVESGKILTGVAEGDPYGHANGSVDELDEARKRKGDAPSKLEKLKLSMAKLRGERTIIPGHPNALHLAEGGNDIPLEVPERRKD